MPKFKMYIIIAAITVLSINRKVAAQAQIQEPTQVVVIDPKKIELKEIASLPKALKEASGLEITKKNHLWTHNDDGAPLLYSIDTLGNQQKTIKINQLNSGWEDLAQDDAGNFYIGAFGNNKNDKKDIKIFKIPNPENCKDPIIKAEVIQYNYSDQQTYPPSAAKKNFDVDAFISLGNALYLFTKNRTAPFSGYTKIYKLTQEPGEQVATLVDSLYLGKGPMIKQWITSADISPDKKTLALLFHDHIWLLKNFIDCKFSQAKIFQLNLNHFSHKAGICFSSNNKLFIVDELEMDILGGKLYSIDLRKINAELK